MNFKYILFVTIFVLTTSGCCLPFPGDTVIINTPISPELMNSIVSDQTIPVSERFIPYDIRNIEGSSDVKVTFKDDFCACSKQRELRMSVSLVSKTGLSGHQNTTGFGKYRPDNDEYGDVCSSFVVAFEAITDAIYISLNRTYFYLDSFNLIWEARAALEPLECDPVKAKILANKAKLLARTVGAKALGFDITGTYDSEFTGEHPIVARHYTLRDQHKPQLVIRQDGQKITGVDGSGTAVLVGTRIENVIKFKFSYPQDFNKELEGEWLVGYDGLNVSGTWRDPVSNASGEWKLMKIQQENKIERWSNKGDHLREFLSRRAPIEIDYEVIDQITVREDHRDWDLECGVGYGIGI